VKMLATIRSFILSQIVALIAPRQWAYALGKFNFLENAILDHVLRGVAFPTIPAIYVALYTTMPDEANAGGVEVSGGAYARQQITRATGSWKDPSTATQGLTENLAAVTFPTATANWGTVLGAALVSTASGAHDPYYFGTLAANKIINTGDVFKFNIGDLEVTED
jgi:hypothetical protein